jgi:hypothetical protein
LTAAPGGSRHFAKSFETSATCGTRKKFERTDNCNRKLHNGSNALPRRSARAKAGWSPERRARQAALIRGWAPWRHSTGPKTEAGKERCSKNALRHGGRSRAHIRELQRIRYVLRLAAENIRKVSFLIQMRQAAACPRLKYKPQYAHVSGRLPWREPGTRAMLRKIRSGGETCVLWQL